MKQLKNRQRDKKTKIQRDKQTKRQTDKQTNRQKDKETEYDIRRHSVAKIEVQICKIFKKLQIFK